MKQHLIDEHRDINVDYDWWGAVYYDFNRICQILGIELDAKEPCFSGFASQGDGASFTGTYRAQGLGYPGLEPIHTAEKAPAKIREYAPEDEELHRIADELCMMGRIYYAPYAHITRYSRSRYYHPNTMQIDTFEPYDSDEDDWAQEVHDEVERILTDTMRDLADWLYRTLEREYDYRTSDEAVWETIVANELCEAHNEEEEQ